MRSSCGRGCGCGCTGAIDAVGFAQGEVGTVCQQGRIQGLQLGHCDAELGFD